MADTNEVAPWFALNFEPDPKTLKLDSGQQSRVRLRPAISGYRKLKPGGALPADIEWFVKVSLDQTTVSPGDMAWDREDKRGYFTHAVVVRIAMDAGWVLSWDSPDSTSEGGSASESKSTQYSVGFFGQTPTATAGGSISSGAGQSFPDFEIVNNSARVGQESLNHCYELRLVEGARYLKPPDLVDATYQLKGRVRGLTPRAVSNLKISSTALFHNARPNPNTVSMLTIEVTHYLVAVEKTWALPGWFPQMTPSYPFRPEFDATCWPLQRNLVGGVLIDTYQANNHCTWQFDVNMNAGKVTLHG